MDKNLVQEYLNQNCGFLDEDAIFFIDQNDLGPVNNVIRKLCPHSFGILLVKEDIPDEYYLFYINNELSLTGLFCKLNLLHPLRNDITYAFSCLTNKYFPLHTRLLRVFNNYQTQTITFAEKMGYITYNDEIDKSLVPKNDSRFIYVPLCDKIKAIRDIFNHKLPVIKKDEKNDYIYLMYNSRNDLTKIGRSIHPINREKTLQGEDPELGIVAVWKDEKRCEKILHQKFSQKRKRGEWFDLDASDFLSINRYIKERKWC